ncbi:agmatine coumaroyltransferase-2-like [Salvia miltiorrhiza]|uniref:agmatine coumaroyltransferase-2-like n=1 Tax=Salvia miltiorrhiza TaxID=226208 RepID=UPI0025AC35D6|nr:agmatine coumaroyltransferase-2-like [Salvia miltiorrhiza]
MKVKIENTRLVKPLYQGTTPRTSDYVPLSVFDKVTYNQHIAVIYAYNPPTQSNAAIELGLRKALAAYRAWAGRFGEDSGGNPIILLNDGGIRFVEASVDYALDRTMLLKPSPFLLSLHPDLKGVAELVQVQLTRFSCGSMVVGFTAHHHVADGHSSSNFLVAWGQATRGLRISPLPFYDRMIFPPRNPPKIEFQHCGAEYIPRNFKKTYPMIDYNIDDVVIHKVHYNAEFISKLKAKASTNTKRFTTIEALLAHLWRAITRARALNQSDTTRLRISVDGRSRLNPKVPNEYFGNLVLWAFATTKVKDLLHEPLSYAAKLLHEAIIKVNDDYFKSFIDYANHEVKDEVPNTESSFDPILWPNLEVDSWLRFPFYDLDFGCGGPYIFMPSFSPVEGMVFLLPSFLGDGSIEAFVPLFQQSLTTFKQICYSLD